MVRTSKSDKQSVPTTTTPAPVENVVVSVAGEKAAAKPRAKKAKEVAVSNWNLPS